MSDARASQNTERLPWIANENNSGGQSYWRGTREFGPRGHGGAIRRSSAAGSGARLLDRDAQLAKSNSAEDGSSAQGDNGRHSRTQEAGFFARPLDT